MDKKHENDEDAEFKEGTSVINHTNESKIIKYKTEEYLKITLLAKNYQ